MRISDWSLDVCSSDLGRGPPDAALIGAQLGREKAPDILLARNFCGILAGKDHEFPAAQSTRSPNIGAGEIGSASCRESVCQYVSISVVVVTLTKKIISTNEY